MRFKESHIFIEGCHILYDGDSAFEPEWFDAAARLRLGWSLEKADAGRQTAGFFRADGVEYLVKHYGRGGFAARLTEDRYLYCGLRRARPYAEWRLLATLCRGGLPAPRPVAAAVTRHGACYTADLIVVSCRPAQPLSSLLRAAPLDEAGWRAVGKTLRRFHDEGVYHADLNAHNVLVAADTRKVVLVDFDRSRIRRCANHWKHANLARLEHSLEKLAGHFNPFYFSRADFSALRDAYCGG